MEDMQVIVVAIGWLGSAVIGYLAAGVRLSEVLGEFTQVKRAAMSALAERGGNARVANEEEMESAMLEFAAIMQNPDITDKPKAIGALALKYPKIAQKLIKKGLKM